MSAMDNWGHWKDFLGDDNMQAAEKMGVSEEIITAFATKIADYLDQNAEPKTDQDRVLADLWQVADETERQVLARVMLKLVTSDRVPEI